MSSWHATTLLTYFDIPFDFELKKKGKSLFTSRKLKKKKTRVRRATHSAIETR